MKSTPSKLGRIITALVLAAAASLTQQPGTAATRMVGNLDDNAGGSLRQLLQDISSGDTIVFPASLFPGGHARTLRLLSGELFITNKNLTIIGPGRDLLTISGNNLGRVFTITNNTVMLRNLTIANGALHETGTLRGGGVYHGRGTLTLSNCAVVGNSVWSVEPGGSASGGGIYNEDILTLISCVVDDNFAAVDTLSLPGPAGPALGGALFNTGTLRLISCVVRNNETHGGDAVRGGSIGENGGPGLGGGVYTSGRLAVLNCAFIGNFAFGGDGADARLGGDGGTGGGGAIYNQGFLGLTNSTFTENQAFAGRSGAGSYDSFDPTSPFSDGQWGSAVGAIDSVGVTHCVSCTIKGNSVLPEFRGDEYFGIGGFRSGGGAASSTCINTIIAGNGNHSPDVSGPFISLGYNLIGYSGASTGFGARGDQVGTRANPIDPKLLFIPAAIPYLAPKPISPVMDKGKNSGLLTDQRGRPRRNDLTFPNAVGGDGTDIGAIEVTSYSVHIFSDEILSIGSVRGALGLASSDGGDHIFFSNVTPQTLVLDAANGPLLVNKTVMFAGPGADLLTISGGGQTRVFEFTDTLAHVSGLTIANGYSDTSGAGVRVNGGNVSFEVCVLSGNGGYGAPDRPTQFGGGLFAEGAEVTLMGCGIFGNSAKQGGGIYCGSSKMLIADSTIAGNFGIAYIVVAYTPVGAGLGVFGSSDCTVLNSTITGNTMGLGDGGGIYAAGAGLKVGNSVIADNFDTQGSPDMLGPVSSLGFNFVGITNGSSGFGAFGDQVGSLSAPFNPMLGPLQDNGGPVPSMLPLPGSPLIGASDDGSDIGASEHQAGPAMSTTPPPNGPGFALSFAGGDYLVGTPPALPAGNSAYTIEAWINTTVMDTGTIASWGNFGVNNEVNAFRLTSTGLVNYWWANDLSVSVDLVGGWHHVAATFDGTTRRILVDGFVLGSNTPVGHNAGIGNFRIGSANGGEFFSGQMDEVRIWNVGRTAGQIREAMRRQLSGNESGLVAYYRLDEGKGGSAFDSTGNANNTVMLANGPDWVFSTIVPFAPPLTTLPVSGITAATATLNGRVDGRSSTTPFEVYFQWGNSPSLGHEQRGGVDVGPGSVPQNFSIPLNGLVPGSTYYYRAAAMTDNGPSYGATLLFQQPCTDSSSLPIAVVLTLDPGQHAIANNFILGGNTLGEVLPDVAQGTVVYVHVPGSGFEGAYYDQFGWTDAGLTVPPGRGMILSTPVSQTLTFYGSIAPGASCPNSPRLFEGHYLVGGPLPEPCTFEKFMGFPPEPDDKVFLYGTPIDTSAWINLFDLEKAQSIHTYSKSGWDVVPVLQAGQAAWVQLAPQRLGLLITKSDPGRVIAAGPPESTWLIEFRPLLGAGPGWQPLTRITLPASGSVAIDDNPSGASRFYRGVRMVYAHDFESVVGAEWSAPSAVSTTPVGGRRFLGEFANDVISLRLTNLPPHTRLTVSFDLFVLRSWDGNDTDFGPDIFQVALRNGPTLFDTTFSNYEPPTQGFPGTSTDNYPNKTGAVESNTLGYTHSNIGLADSVYRLTATFNHNASTVILDFRGLNLQGIGDESWGLDNVRVEAFHAP